MTGPAAGNPTPQEAQAPAGAAAKDATALAAQRLWCAAAASGNRMLAGARAVFLGGELLGDAAAQPLYAALQHYAARLRCRLVAAEGAAASAPQRQRESHSPPTDFVITATASPVAAELVTNVPQQLPPLYLPLPATAFTDPAMYAAAYQTAAAALATHLVTLGFLPVQAERADILEFAVTGATKIPNAPSRFGERLAVLTQLTADPKTAAAADRLRWATRGMPVTAAIAQQMPQLARERILVSLINEPKTAALAVLLQQAGAEVAVFAPANECDATVAAELTAQGITVFAPGGGCDAAAEADPHPAAAAATADSAAQTTARRDALNALAALQWQPTLLIDDGSHLIRLAHTQYPQALETLRAAAEETTSGVRPLREMAANNQLRLPVIAVNNARTKTLFDNRVGTGESCVHAILQVVDQPAASQPWVVWGYGPVGEGVARAAAAYGAKVSVIEPDAVRALQAVCDGYQVITEAQLPQQPFIAVSATGVWHTIKAATIIQHWDTMTLAVAGGIDNEIAVDDLTAAGWSFVATAHPQVKQLQNPAGQVFQTRLLAAGGGINYTAAEGNPLEVMDLSFATQLAALSALVQAPQDVQHPGVHELPESAAQAVAAAALRARALSVAQPGSQLRYGGAAQPWQIHRYRLQHPKN